MPRPVDVQFYVSESCLTDLSVAAGLLQARFSDFGEDFSCIANNSYVLANW